MNPTSSDLTNQATEEKWQEYMMKKGLSKERTAAETLLIARQCFFDGCQYGQVVVISSMKEIYYNDPCLFEEYFEENGEDEKS